MDRIEAQEIKENENLCLVFTSPIKRRKRKCNVPFVCTVDPISTALSARGLISRTAAGNRA